MPESAVFKITKTNIYPNPVNASKSQEMTVEFYSTKRCSKAEFVFYTRAYRKIMTYEAQTAIAAGVNRMIVPAFAFGNLSPGVYYAQVTAEDEDGEKERGKAVVVVVLK